MEKRRKKLWSFYRTRINQVFNPWRPLIRGRGDNAFAIDSIDEFNNYFEDADNAKLLKDYLDSKDAGSFPDLTLVDFINYYCCDLTWARSYCDGRVITDPIEGFGPSEEEENKETTTPTPIQPPVPQPVTGGKCESITYTENDILNGVAKIKNCMKGDVVGKIQSLLKTCGFPYFSKSGNIDNIYGPRTEKMVMAFQELPNSGLSDDGVVGKDTYKKLQSCKTSSTTTSPTTTTTTSPTTTINTTAPIKISDPSIDDTIGIFD
jgi:hypothetical protein